MLRVYAIALNTFREAVRDRVLYGLFACAVVVLVFSLALGALALHEEDRVVYDIGMASISLFSVVLAVFLGSSLLYKEIQRKTLYVILPKPLHRGEFLLGKYLGIVLTAVVFLGMIGSVQLLVSAVQVDDSASLGLGVAAALLIFLGVGLWRAPDRTTFMGLWSIVALIGSSWVYAEVGLPISVALAQLLLCLGEVLVLTSVAMFFSSFSTPFLTGLLTVGVWFVGRSADTMASMRGDEVGHGVQDFLQGLSYIAPNLNLFVPGRHTLLEHAEGYGGAFAYVGSSMLYGVLYAAIVLVAAALVFRRRDFL
jgi:ABC-type transport system involved in multi-copper enzyme maturation permease subunit